MQMNEIVKEQRHYYTMGATQSVEFRLAQLKKLYALVKDNEEALNNALALDLGKSAYEAYITEIGIVLSELSYAIKHLKKWSKPKKVLTPLSLFPSSSQILKEPYGVALILSPWNYPVQLALVPAIGAIAAGNCVILKASKSSIHTTALLQKMINANFESSFFTVLDGSLSYEEILAEKVDTIFFTGSERVGKIVMEAASKHCTPISLELGGKSPVFVDDSADLDLAAKRILWGKLINCGQTCVAPDYILVQDRVKDKLIEQLLFQKATMIGDAINNPEYPHIINEHHFKRLKQLIENEKHKTTCAFDEKALRIEPVLFTEVTFDSEIMQEEIFGPILPILSFACLDDAIQHVVDRPKPLACYIFSRNRAHISKLTQQVSFGGGCINDTVMHLANHHLPFGGVGSSGLGHYHGKASFDTFTHEKSILKTPYFLDMPFRYQPYQHKLLGLIKRLLK